MPASSAAWRRSPKPPKDVATLGAALDGLPVAYDAWAQAQAQLASGLDGVRRREVAEKCLKDIETARKRIEAGIARLKADVASREAFGIMNRVMARSNRQRGATLNGKPPDQQTAPTWRLFQLAFILLNLDGLADPTHPDRPIVDLLFFPTGGGKTEAYLGLAAFAIARRRLNNPGLEGAGLSVVMRYTLRLLTLDQLQRAAGLVCALELERKAQPERLGILADRDRPLGRRRGDAQQSRQREEPQGRHGRLLAGAAPQGKRTGARAAEDLPLVRDRLQQGQLSAASDGRDAAAPRHPLRRGATAHSPARIACRSSSVDEEIYRRLPAFMIATIDKFANVPWEGASGAFFGHVERYDQSGFYGAAEPGGGTRVRATNCARSTSSFRTNSISSRVRSAPSPASTRRPSTCWRRA